MKNQGDIKRPISPRKLEANRRNAQKSTGPRTAEGKAKSSRNSYTHGLYSSRLYRDENQRAKEEPEFLEILNGFREHYQPVGFVENFWLERVAVEAFRYARNLSHEQNVLRYDDYFLSSAPNSLQRYQGAISKQLAQTLAQLEAFQAARKAIETSEDPGDESDEMGTIAGPPASPRSAAREKDNATRNSERHAGSADSQDVSEGAPYGNSADEIVETNPTDVPAIVAPHESAETNPRSSAPRESLQGTQSIESTRQPIDELIG
jgi:hypothetical protein